tara:strand:- start:160 stop:354 length:195 start_codon:yes stop_codon:yes gene_type:complete|eukprot:PRCOL_00001090-RA
MGESILRDGVTLYQGRTCGVDHRKGIGLIFPNQDKAADGDGSESGDAGGSPGKSSLFFLTAFHP